MGVHFPGKKRYVTLEWPLKDDKTDSVQKHNFPVAFRLYLQHSSTAWRLSTVDCLEKEIVE